MRQIVEVVDQIPDWVIEEITEDGGAENERSAVCPSDVQVSVLSVLCSVLCSTTVPSRLRAGDRYWRRATSGTAVPMHHGNSCASGSLVVCPKYFGFAAADGARERA